jgi:hypothetical protein
LRCKQSFAPQTLIEPEKVIDGTYDLQLLWVKVESWGLSFLLKADYLQRDHTCKWIQDATL